MENLILNTTLQKIFENRCEFISLKDSFESMLQGENKIPAEDVEFITDTLLRINMANRIFFLRIEGLFYQKTIAKKKEPVVITISEEELSHIADQTFSLGAKMSLLLHKQYISQPAFNCLSENFIPFSQFYVNVERKPVVA